MLIHRYIILLILILADHEVFSQCTFSSTFANTAWHDNTKGTLTFTDTTMSGWTFGSNTGRTVRDWQCLDNTDSNFLVLRTTSTFTLRLDTTTKTVYAYLCMELTTIKNGISFIYYQRQVQQPNIGEERLRVSELSDLTKNDVCNTGISVPTLEFHVLIKSGSESDAAITCPGMLLFSADYTYTGSDDTVACTTTLDHWDICTDTSAMSVDYTRCTTQILFSGEGNLWCVANMQYGAYSYTVVYNRDTTLTTSTRRFSCLSTDGNFVTVAPNNCTSNQNPYNFPLLADQVTTTGHRLFVANKYVSCAGGSDGLSPGAIAGIVISVLFFLYWVSFTMILISVFLFFCMLAFLAILSTQVKSEKPKLDIKATEKLMLPLEEVAVTSPSDVLLKTGTDTPKLHKNTHEDMPKVSPRRKKV